MAMAKRVKDLMVENVKTVDLNISVQEAVNVMAKNNIGALVVLSPIQEAIGVFTERDLLKRVAAYGVDMQKTRVSEVMTPKFQCVQAEDELDGLPEIMIRHNFRHLPVVDGHQVIGMLSMRDLLKYLCQIK